MPDGYLLPELLTSAAIFEALELVTGFPQMIGNERIISSQVFLKVAIGNTKTEKCE